MGRLAVYKFAYFLSILFTFFILGLSIFAYFSGKINPAENMFAAYVALSKPILVATNAILFIYWLIRLRYCMDSVDQPDGKLRIHHFHVSDL